MIRLRLGVDDVAGTRFAAPSPYCELSVSAQVIQQPTSSFRRLCAASGVRLPASASHFLELVPAHGNVPDFLAPEGANSLEEALDIVMSTPDRLIRNDMATLPWPAASSWMLDLADGCVSARKELASSLRDYHDQVLKLLWPAIEHVLETDLRFRAWQLATTGVAATVMACTPAFGGATEWSRSTGPWTRMSTWRVEASSSCRRCGPARASPGAGRNPRSCTR